MKAKKVELLAPAGNYQALVGAFRAGADAVYLGGQQFGARAYADNFTEEEILKALRYAHFYGRKIYLTVNTLLKETEIFSLYDYIAPFYEAGLDGVIIQDLGVWQYIKERFPDMPLHASTQMTITGAGGASFLREIGASRIVPARELSLMEIKKIKERTGLELECFIHGAMCYCYSGACLFSSILGGRSGNRGKCAQPCRLPYKVLNPDKDTVSEEMYPLSLKDMCTIEYIPKLIEAGIDSFKIEGRMKKPEYAAGVTAIYRKYIDWYYEKGADGYRVEKTDMDNLRRLYIRSEVQTGYYERTNGREMITLQKPGYLGSDETLLQDIAGKYLQEEEKYPVTIRAAFRVNEPAMLQIEGAGITHTSYGAFVQQARKRPMTQADFSKQLRKTGNSYVYIAHEEIDADEAAFMPIVQINELRRDAVEAFENKVMEAQGFVRRNRQHNLMQINYETEKEQKKHLQVQEGFKRQINPEMTEIRHHKPHCKPKLHVTVQNLEQLQAVSEYPCERIYIDSDFYMEGFDQVSQYMENDQDFAIYLALPYVLRDRDASYLQRLYPMLHERISGFLVRNLEAVSWVLSLPEKPKTYDMVTDAGVYIFNAETVRFWYTYSRECYLPWELNQKECRQMMEHSKGQAPYLNRQNGGEDDMKISMIAYGTIPMMLTANCLKKTTGVCNGKSSRDRMYLTDRYQTAFSVLCNCKHCYNIIYNSVPYSIHQKREALEEFGLFAIRLDFVWETAREVEQILDFYTGKTDTFPVERYTTGHYKRGVK